MSRTRPLDTSREAWRLTREAHARLGPEGRVTAAFEASEFCRALALEGIRQRHPDYDGRTLRLALLRLLYGDAIFSKVYPGEHVLP